MMYHLSYLDWFSSTPAGIGLRQLDGGHGLWIEGTVVKFDFLYGNDHSKYQQEKGLFHFRQKLYCINLNLSIRQV